MPRTTDAPGEDAVPMLAEQVMPLLVANCPGIQCKMVGACCYSRCHATKEIARQLAEVRRLRAALAEARPVVAAAVAWCHTYAVRDLTPEESALMTAVAAREDALAARDGGGEAAAPPR